MVFRWLRRNPEESQRLAASEAALGRAGADGYPGDFTGTVTPRYDPHPDGVADPGEVVWGWVPYEDDHNRGKDRPVLIIGMDGEYLLGLMLTSKDHDRDARAEAAQGRHWFDVGAGGWDSQRRPSEVRLDRVLRLRPDAVRREGAALSRQVFERVSWAFTALARE
ncbi:MAG TPA: type II toxin-antitoxin system PemK/MazF family toxin [Jatrophihabitans sp.]